MRYSFSLPVRDDAQLHQELLALGLPGFLELTGSRDTVELNFGHQLTVEEHQQVLMILQAHQPLSWDEWRSRREREEAKRLIYSQDRHEILLRAALKLIMQSVVETREYASLVAARVNEVARHAGLMVEDLPPLPSGTWEEMEVAAQALIDAGEANRPSPARFAPGTLRR